jgi:hypothetical protein
MLFTTAKNISQILGINEIYCMPGSDSPIFGKSTARSDKLDVK